MRYSSTPPGQRDPPSLGAHRSWHRSTPHSLSRHHGHRARVTPTLASTEVGRTSEPLTMPTILCATPGGFRRILGRDVLVVRLRGTVPMWAMAYVRVAKDRGKMVMFTAVRYDGYLSRRDVAPRSGPGEARTHGLRRSGGALPRLSYGPKVSRVSLRGPARGRPLRTDNLR